MSKKTIKIKSHSHCAIYADYKTPWEDVWLELKVRRKKIYLAPCILSLSSLKSDIEIEKEISQIRPYSKDLKRLLHILNELSSGCKYYIEDFEDTTPNIYVGKEAIDRKAIEYALDFYLRQLGHLKSEPRFEWVKPRLCTISM